MWEKGRLYHEEWPSIQWQYLMRESFPDLFQRSIRCSRSERRKIVYVDPVRGNVAKHLLKTVLAHNETQGVMAGDQALKGGVQPV